MNTLGCAKRVFHCGVFMLALAGVTRAGFAQTAMDTVTVNKALKSYERYTKQMSVDSISKLFRFDGELANQGQRPIVGPSLIYKFLQNYYEYKVLSHTMTSQKLVFRGDSAFQTGTFDQRVKTPKGAIQTAHGTFELHWIRETRIAGVSTWRIRRMTTAPA